MEAFLAYLAAVVDWSLANPDLIGTVLSSYFVIQAFKRFLPKDTRALASVIVCAALTVFNPMRDWGVAESLMYGGLMGFVQIAGHSLSGPMLRFGLKKWLGDREGEVEWKRMEAQKVAEARAEAREHFESTRSIAPPTMMQTAAKKLHDTLT